MKGLDGVATAGAAILLVAAIASLVPARAQLDELFMPKGGRALLLEVLGERPGAPEVRDIVQARRSADEWQVLLAPRSKPLSEAERQTLASYLAINMPLDEPAQAAAGDAQALAAALPRDGRDLAWNECQSCHSLFTSYLTQSRDVTAWLNMFQSPFHRVIKFTERERREFADYAARHMPMKVEDVPPELRF